MVWSYLSQFWDSITEIVVTSGTYTVSWFQSIGNAVAGAIGSMFDNVFHLMLDVLTALGFYINILFNFFKALIVPFDYFFHYLISCISVLFSPLTYTSDLNYEMPSKVLEFFNAIPYWSFFSYSIGAIVLFLVGYKIIRLILKI